MTAYAIGLYKFKNLESWHPKYKEPVTKLIEKHGGRYVSRASASPWEILEGAEPIDATSFTLIEFPDMASARAWHSDPEYQEFIRLRQGSGTELKLILVDGCDG